MVGFEKSKEYQGKTKELISDFEILFKIV